MPDPAAGPADPRPVSTRGYLVAAVVAVASIAIAAGLIVWLVRSASDYELTPLSQGDTITVGTERRALFAQLEPGADPADDFFCIVTQGDQWEYAKKSGSMYINEWTRVGVTPEGLAPGEYVVTCSGLPTTAPMAVGDQPNIGGNVAKGVAAGLIGIGGCLFALILVIVTAVRRSAAKKPPRPPMPPPGPHRMPPGAPPPGRQPHPGPQGPGPPQMPGPQGPGGPQGPRPPIN